MNIESIKQKMNNDRYFNHWIGLIASKNTTEDKKIYHLENAKKRLEYELKEKILIGEEYEAELKLINFFLAEKTFKIQFNIGKCKYVINHHDGSKKHADGSKFFDIDIYSNKKKFEVKISQLLNLGYKEIN